jgi:D-3-phosphoglycerate dehydrogenase / 2-oxoglutarate reductase
MRNVDLPWLQFEQVVATPHIGYVTHEEYETQFSDVFDQSSPLRLEDQLT